jgi:Protein of unknown function (DUF1579)
MRTLRARKTPRRSATIDSDKQTVADCQFEYGSTSTHRRRARTPRSARSPKAPRRHIGTPVDTGVVSTVSVSLLAFAGIAFAQPAPAKAPPTPAPAPAPAPAKEMPPPAAAPVAPKPPEPPPEVTAMAKAMNGTWKCTGKADVRGTQMDIKVTISHRVDVSLNKFWIVSSAVATAPKMPPMKSTTYTTYDATSKKTWRVSVGGMGQHSTGWGTITDTKTSYEMEGTGPMGAFKMRHSEEMVSPKEVKVTGELSRDNGKTWVFDRDALCKK